MITGEMIERAATAMDNFRRSQSGLPELENGLELIGKTLRDRTMGMAEAALKAVFGTSDAEKVTIIVNGCEKEITSKVVGYDDIVFLVYARVVEGLTVTYRKGWVFDPQGTLAGKGSINVVDGMIFNVSDTSNA